MKDDHEEGSWMLAFAYDVKEENENSTNIESISEEKFLITSLQKAQVTISDYHQSAQLINCVKFNIGVFKETVRKSLVEYSNIIEKNHMPPSADHVSYSILNILNSFRAFIDHSNYSISKTFGKKSKPLSKWKKAQTEIFDKHFEYRFIYKLRNYCQHVGIPPVTMSFSQTAEDEKIKCNIDIKTETLLEERTVWGAKLTKEIENSPSLISVLSVIKGWAKTFLELSGMLIAFKQRHALIGAMDIISLRSRFGLPKHGGKLCIVFTPEDQPKPAFLTLKMHWLPEQTTNDIVNRNA